jgi:TetR/AcrR family transcriptional regulator, tetracycline repressor protein
MARPKVPLISRDKALQTALRILDEEGMEALSIRRLASELNVNGASLYHHFDSKDAILVEATELALANTPIVVRSDGSDWRYWMLDGARQLRDVLVAHPALIPIIVRRRTLGIRAEGLELITRKLIGKGVPAEMVIPLFEALERFVIGTAIRQASGEAVLTEVDEDATYPHLQLASMTRAPAGDELFDVVALGIMDALHRSVRDAEESSVADPPVTETPSNRKRTQSDSTPSRTQVKAAKSAAPRKSAARTR